MFFVYIIYSELADCYYKGFSTNVERRLQEHNEGQSRFTSCQSDWKLIHLESFASKSNALIREKRLKKYSKSQIEELSKTKKNLLNGG
jgi:putative endonuclease